MSDTMKKPVSHSAVALLAIISLLAAMPLAAQESGDPALAVESDAENPAAENPAVEPAPEPLPETPPEKPRRRRAHQVGEIDPHRFIFTATFGSGARIWGGDVTGLRFTPLVELGVGVNFNRKWGLISLTRVGLNDLDRGRDRYTGWSVIGLQRHKQRQVNTWGAGIAFREVADAGSPGGTRRQYGGDALWRVDFLDKPYTWYFAADLACYPRQCVLGFSWGVGFYF